jgi:hypothetical protein
MISRSRNGDGVQEGERYGPGCWIANWLKAMSGKHNKRLTTPSRKTVHPSSMKSASDRFKRKSLLLITGTTAFLLCLEVSRADVLYWATSQLSTNSFANGYGFAEKTLRLKGAQNLAFRILDGFTAVRDGGRKKPRYEIKFTVTRCGDLHWPFRRLGGSTQEIDRGCGCGRESRDRG